MTSLFSRRDFLSARIKADQVELDGYRIRVHARSSDVSAAYPRCGTVSRHVHSKYRRRLADGGAVACALLEAVQIADRWHLLEVPSIMAGEKIADAVLGRRLPPENAAPWLHPDWEHAQR